MERGFPHPWRMYPRRGAGPWFTRTDMPHENSWAGSPFPQWSQDNWDPQRGRGPPDPHWGHLNNWRGHNHQNSQCSPVPRWDQYQGEQPSRVSGCGFDNDNFLHRGRGFYRRRSHGRFYGKRSSSFYKGKERSLNTSCVLVAMQSKKENDSEVKKDESAIPKETEQAQEDSVASVKNTDLPQVSQEDSKATISASQFSFNLPPDSLIHPTCSPAKTGNSEQVSQEASKAIISLSQFTFCLPPDSTCPTYSATKTEDAELLNLGTDSKTKDGHKVACCTQAVPSELPATLENLELKQEEEEIELDKLKGSLAAEAQPREAASLPSANAPMEGQAPSNTAGSFNPVVKEKPMSDTGAHSCQAASLLSDETPIGKQAPSKVTESIHPLVKEEPVPVPETKQDMNISSSIDPSPVTKPSAPSSIVEPPAPLETREALLSLGREEDELTQMGGSHEDYLQARVALAGGSSALPVIPSAVHSVPVLVSRKETELPYFWESESSLHDQSFDWSDGGRGWAPEDYQEPTWGVNKAENCGDVSEPDEHLALSHSSSHSCHSCDQNPDNGKVLECCSSSAESHHSSDSKHSSTQRATKCLRSPLRQGHHSRSPLSQRLHSRSPLRGREIIRTSCCNKCHCRCCQNPSPEVFRERKLPHSYTARKMHRCHPSKESSKSYRIPHSYSAENSKVKSQTRKMKSTSREKTKKGRSTSVKQTRREETKKGRSTSVKQAKSSTVKKKGRKVLAAVNHDAALADEISIPSETTEHFQPANTEGYESVQLAASSEDTDFPHQPCAGKETGTSAPSKVAEDPRSVAVLTRKNQIEQDYLQAVLDFSMVATMLLQKEPCMEEALEAALRTYMRSVGDHYEGELKNFIDDYDLSETC